MPSKVLVTGASGFIGSTLIEKLSGQGDEVYALMRKTSSPSNLGGFNYERVIGDLRDLESLKKAVQGMDVIYHLAGVVSASNRQEYFEHNAKGTGLLAHAVAQANPDLKRFVYVSSLSAAGPAKELKPRIEEEEESPVSSYGESKLGGERELLKYKDAYPISIVRPPIVYGPKDKGVFTIIQTVGRNLMPIIKGATDTGHKYYSAVHVEDLCEGILRAGRASEEIPSGEVFYVSGDGIFTYEEFLGTIATCLGKKPIKIRVPRPLVTAAAYGLSALSFATRKNYPFNIDKLNEILPDYWICSNEKAKAQLSFAPRYDLRSGMSHAVEWYRRQGWI